MRQLGAGEPPSNHQVCANLASSDLPNVRSFLFSSSSCQKTPASTSKPFYRRNDGSSGGLMGADQDKRSPLGLKALVGHLLQDLPSRLFQLVRAIWTFLIGPWAPSAWSLLPSGWVVHQSVQPEELPRVLEALGLHSWERLGECYEELGQETGLAESWKDFASSQYEDSFNLAIEELTTWQKAMLESNLKVFLGAKLVSWEDSGNECHYETSVDHTYTYVKSDEVLTWVDEKDAHDTEDIVDFSNKDEIMKSPRKDKYPKNAFVDIPSQDRIERSPMIMELSQVQQRSTSKPMQDISDFLSKDEVDRSTWLLQPSQVQEESMSNFKQDGGLSSDNGVKRSARKDDDIKNAFVDFAGQDENQRSMKPSQVQQILTSKPVQDLGQVQEELMSKHKQEGSLSSKNDFKRLQRKDGHPKNAFVDISSQDEAESDFGFSSKDKDIRSFLDQSQVQQESTAKLIHDNGDLPTEDQFESSPKHLEPSQVQEKLISSLMGDGAFSSENEVKQLTWFQEQSQLQEVLTSKTKVINEMEFPDSQTSEAPIQCTPIIQLSLPSFEGHQSQFENLCNQPILQLSPPEFEGHQFEKLYNQPEPLKGIADTILELAGMGEELSYGIQELETRNSPHHNCPPSPEKDQGYYSLEDWQCSEFTQNIQNTPIATLESVSNLPTELETPPIAINHDCEDQKNDLDIIEISVPTCANKHIGYILGTIISDDEDEDLSSDDDNEDSDDGFDSEGSLSTTDSEDSEETINWSSFSSSDPYSLQNFTANLQTGSTSKETLEALVVLPQDPPRSDDEESWCDSEAESDSEEDCSADEEENQKLWNAFFKSEDPYNPLHFRAPVITTDRKRLSPETRNKMDLPSCQDGDPRNLALIDRCLEKRTRPGHKKVTFLEKVTIYTVCNEEERKGHWEELARDRCRFQRRIQETESTIGHCLSPGYRKRVWLRMQEQWGS